MAPRPGNSQPRAVPQGLYEKEDEPVASLHLYSTGNEHAGKFPLTTVNEYLKEGSDDHLLTPPVLNIM